MPRLGREFLLCAGLIVLIAGLGQGCDSTDDGDTLGTSSATGGGEEAGGVSTGSTKAPSGLPTLDVNLTSEIRFLQPATGLEVPNGNEVLVEIYTSFFKLVEPNGTNDKGVGHYGIYLDNLSDSYLLKSYGTQAFLLLPELSVGAHSLTAVLLNNDGTVVADAKSDTVGIEVIDNDGGGGASITMLEPLDGMFVSPGQKLTVRVETENVVMVDPFADEATVEAAFQSQQEQGIEHGHFRVYLGYDEDDDYAGVSAGTEVEITLPETLFPGQHQLRVELRGVDGTKMQGAANDGESGITIEVAGLKKPTLSIVSPQEGDLLIPGALTSLDLDLSNFELVTPGGLAGGEVDVADGHVRVYLDDASGEDYLTAEASTAPSFTLPVDLSAGAHTLNVVLVDTENSPVGTSGAVVLTTPGLTVVSPAANSWVEYDKDTQITVEFEYFELLDPEGDTAPEIGKGHYRVYLDDADGDDYLLASGNASDVIRVGNEVTAGQHTLRFSVREKNGAPVGFEEFISVFVGAGPPSVSVASPLAGKTVHPGSTLTFGLAVENFALQPVQDGGTNVYGQGHYRIYMDNAQGNSYVAAGDALPALVALPESITLGPHTFRVGLYNNDSSPLDVEAEVWLDVVSNTTPVVQATAPAPGTIFAQGSEFEFGVEVLALDLVPESGINGVGEGHLEIRLDGGDVLYSGSENPGMIQLPADVEVGVHTLDIQLVTNTGSTIPNAKDQLTIGVWEMPSVEVVSPESGTHVVWGESLELTLAVTGASLTAISPDAVNQAEQVHYSVSLADENAETESTLVSGSAETLSLDILDDLSAGDQAFRVSLFNNDGTSIVGADTLFDFVMDAPDVEFLFPDGLTQVYRADGIMNMELSIDFFDMVPPSAGLLDILGEGHYLLYLDGAVGANFFFEGNDLSFALPLPVDLAPGEHSLRVALVSNVNASVGIETNQTFHIADSGLAVVSPAKGSEWTANTPASLDLIFENFTLKTPEEGDENVDLEGHFGVYLDDGAEPFMVDATPTPLVTLDEGIAAGEHVLRVALMNNDGTLVEPPCEVFLPLVVVE